MRFSRKSITWSALPWQEQMGRFHWSRLALPPYSLSAVNPFCDFSLDTVLSAESTPHGAVSTAPLPSTGRYAAHGEETGMRVYTVWSILLTVALSVDSAPSIYPT